MTPIKPNPPCDGDGKPRVSVAEIAGILFIATAVSSP
jgi:hypothetical protein